MGIESKNSEGKNFISNKDLSRFRTRSNSKDTLAQFEDPTYLGFKLFFRGIDDATHGGLLGATSNPNSARYYLKQIGDEVRFKMLDTFVKMLKKINTEYPWYFQTIGGLDEAWKRRAEIEKPAIKGQLSVDCIESLDLRISSLIDLYRKSAYDWVNKREILTDNLRHFELDVMIYDNRTFSQSLQGDKIGGKSGGNTAKQEEVNKTFFGESEFDYSQFMFHLSFVEINLESGSNIFSNISNSSTEAAQQSIIFEYELIEESNLFKILSMLYKSDNKKFWYVKDYVNNILTTLSGTGVGGFNTSLLGGSNIQTSENIQNESNKFNAKEALKQAKEKAGKEIGNITDDFLNNIQKDVESGIRGTIQSQANALFTGNVYGFSSSSILSGGGAGLADKAIGSASNKLGNTFNKNG